MRYVGPACGALAMAIIVLGACARQAERPVPPRPTIPAPRPPPAPVPGAVGAADYVATASSIDLFEIRSSEVALQRSNSPRVREFASMMIQAHRGTSAQLSFAGRRLNLLPSATPMPKHQAMLEALLAASDFDAVYKQQQGAVHRDALTLHAGYAARGASPTLRPVAAAMRPIIERHLRLLQYL